MFLLRKGKFKMSEKTERVFRGEIHLAYIGSGEGSEQSGVRPVLVLQNDIGNKYSPTTIVAMITSRRKSSLPVHVAIPKTISGLAHDSIVLLEQIKTIDKSRLRGRIGSIAEMNTLMDNISQAMSISLGMVDLTQPTEIASC